MGFPEYWPFSNPEISASSRWALHPDDAIHLLSEISGSVLDGGCQELNPQDSDDEQAPSWSELADALKRKLNCVEISATIGEHVVKIQSVGSVSWIIAFSAIALAVGAVVAIVVAAASIPEAAAAAAGAFGAGLSGVGGVAAAPMASVSLGTAEVLSGAALWGAIAEAAGVLVAPVGAGVTSGVLAAAGILGAGTTLFAVNLGVRARGPAVVKALRFDYKVKERDGKVFLERRRLIG